MPNNKKKFLRLLFVCYGNVCRSPMAEAIARKVLGDDVHAESAGIAASTNNPAAAEAVVVAREDYDQDISSHGARHVSNIPLEDFDIIFALDPLVYEYLKNLNQIPSDNLIEWDITDPVGLSKFAYQQSAQTIEANLRRFFVNRAVK